MSEHETNVNDQETAEVLGSPKANTLKPEIPETLISDKKDPEAFKKQFQKTGKISIKPFVDGTVENMGLERYDMSVFPGISHEEQLAALERNGVTRYITGLDEFAAEVQNIVNKEQKEAVIYNIRSIVAYLEKMLATNVLKIEDEHFWSKVKLLRPDNHAFWSKITVRCSNEPTFLDPGKEPYDLIKMMAIEAGGFDLVGKSYDDALAAPVSPKFFLDKEVHTVSAKTVGKRLHNRATSVLDKLSNNNHKKLLYITKAIDSNSAIYKNNTPLDILYDALDDYISGKGVERSPSKAAEHFLNVADLDMETLKLKALVKDASFYKVISLKPDGMLYHTVSSTMLGRNVSDVVLYLKNPLNEDMLTKLLTEIEGYWEN